MVRVRIAPSPTGIPHIGNTRTALFNFLFARHNHGVFILRIEDTDQKRIVPGAREAIFEILHWLGLEPDEVYTQSERLDIYKKATEELLEKGFARKDEGAIRFIVPKGELVHWEDSIGKKRITFNTKDIEDFIILKSDGFPTYHLANVVDDHLMHISHVIRGDEWISSTPKHLLLYKAFGWKPPVFAHLPVILGPDKTKLSKRHGAKSVLDFREEGYLPEAILNFMALLGWNPGGNREILSLSEMIQLFDLKDVNTASPVFDIGKLNWLNGYYIRQKSVDELVDLLIRQNPKFASINKDDFRKLVFLSKTRMRTLLDFEDLVRPYFVGHEEKLEKAEKEIARKLLLDFKEIKEWKSDAILEIFRKEIATGKATMKTFYKIFMGRDSGLPLPAFLEILGKQKTLERLQELTK